MKHCIYLHKLQAALYEPQGKMPRILTDRLWPRGVRKEALGDIVWYRNASPESALRQGFHRGTLTRAQFELAYRQQLAAQPESWECLLHALNTSSIQLLTATKDPHTSYLVILQDVLQTAYEGAHS